MRFTQHWTATIENRHNVNKKISIMPSKLLSFSTGNSIYETVDDSNIDLK